MSEGKGEYLFALFYGMGGVFVKRCTIGILAHVDSGKTTLSEAILYRAGLVRSPGRVDHGSALLDSHQIERERGITIFSSQASFSLGETEVTLVDTPGHVDFSAEAERTLQILDYAILVVSGTDGVQSHTQTLWKLLKRYEIPVFFFINKMDLPGPGQHALMAQLNSHFSDRCVSFDEVHNRDLREEIALCNESLMNAFLEDHPLPLEQIRKAIAERQLFPCFFGSALKGEGITPLLEGLDRLTCQPNYPKGFGARIFKITQGEQGERVTHLKITGGTLTTKDALTFSSPEGKETTEKINQIRLYTGAKFKPVPSVCAGAVCAVTGLSHALPGQGLGIDPGGGSAMLEPVLRYRMILPDGTDPHQVFSQLKQLEEEDPQLHLIWNSQMQEIHLRVMGEVQLEVLREVLARRFSLSVDFAYCSISYLETIAHPVEGVGHYEPLRHYAEVHLLLEPAPRGSGLHFAVDCSEDMLDKNWKRLALTHLQEQSHPGVLTGFPITDMKITLIAGRAHLKHTSGGDFRQATYRAVRQGLRSAESILLEPWYAIHFTLPRECVGRVMTDIQQRGGRLDPPEDVGDTVFLDAYAPVAAMQGYQTELAGFSRGRGQMSCTVTGYEPCRNAEEVIAQIGYRPEEDTEHPADSVFCSHGAGVIVPWDQVRERQHVDSGLRWEKTEETQEQAKRYLNRVADDEELMRIFERTYGPIKRPAHNALHTKKEPPAPKPAKPRPVFSGKEYLLIDGYNIIFSWPELHALAEKNIDLARETLIHRLCNYQGVTRQETILVFDAYRVKGAVREIERVCNLYIVYTKEAETADMYIEKATHQLGKNNRVRVATSDRLEQLIIIGNGAIRISADAFLAEVTETERQIKELIDAQK